MENRQSRSPQSAPSLFSRISSWLFGSLKGGIFGHFFTSYDKTNEGFVKALSKRKDKGRRTKKTIARALEKNPFVGIVPRLQAFLLKVSLRSYGIVLFTMALFTCGLFLLQSYTSIIHSPLSSLIAGIVLGAISLPMMASNKSIANVLFTRKWTNRLMFGFLGIREDDYRDAEDEKPHSSPSIALLAGMILSVISYFTSPLWTIATIVILFLAYEVLISPESGVVMVILSIPFTSTLVMSIMGLYVTICYIIKCVVGKRTFKFEFIDLWASILMFFIILSGFASFDVGSSVKEMLLCVALMSSFFVVANLVRSKEWYKRCIVAICLSSTISALIGILQFVFGRLDITWDKMKAFATIHTKASGTFDSPDAFALYLLISLAFLLLFVFSGKTGKATAVGLICSLINLTAIMLTCSKVGYIGTVAMIAFFLLAYHRNNIYVLLVGVATGFILNYGLPEQAKDLLSSVMATPENSHAYRVELFRNVFEIIKTRPFGIGAGQGAFESAYRAIIGTGGATNAGNLYLQITLSCGIIGLIVFVSFLIVFARLCFSYASRALNNLHRINALAGFSAFIGILVAGFYSYVFADKSILFMSCIAIALSLAYIRVEREAYDRPRTEFVDILSADVEIELDKDATIRENVPKRKYVRISRKKAMLLAEDDSGLEVIKDNEFDSVMYED
ncbi:MAG: hypothetical protein E7622_05705 [Ruminococcaceae bacterium]|nr:hypothetical protein [Oscillospiraceae bacterium]